MSKFFRLGLALVTLTLIWAVSAVPVSTHAQTAEGVTLNMSTLEWETFAYELAEDNTIVPGSWDITTITPRTFTTWIIENEYLKVTLVPESDRRTVHD